MDQALAAAARARASLGIDGAATARDLERVADVAGIDVADVPMSGDLYGAFQRIEHDGVDVKGALVRAGLGHGQRLYVLAHELGHGILGHLGNHLYTADSCRLANLYRDRNELDAHLFGGCFLVGLPVGDGFDDRLREAQEMGVPGESLLLYQVALDKRWRGGLAGFIRHGYHALRSLAWAAGFALMLADLDGDGLPDLAEHARRCLVAG